MVSRSGAKACPYETPSPAGTRRTRPTAELRLIAGRVTMDTTMADCGDDDVVSGDEVVLIGTQGAETITASEIAEKTNTINYEVVCSVGPRVPRRYIG